MIIFVKPFRKVKEGEIYKPSIVAFLKHPYMAKRYGKKEIITQYEYHLYINLWLLELTFNWRSKEKI